MSTKETSAPEEPQPTVAKQIRPMRMAQGMRAWVVAGPDVGAHAPSPQPKLFIGRSPTAELRLTDLTASVFHVELAVDAGGIVVRDLESLNGTYYQGARIRDATVPSGATLQIGSSFVQVELDVPVEAETNATTSFGELRGASPAMSDLFSLLIRLAPTELGVLIEGPTGTGKELIARALHAESLHRNRDFVVLDCTAIPASLAESVLFGHERGAFTGASERRPGVFEAAGDGTIFLDEVGELPPELQPKLLRVLERREIVRVGSSQPVPMRARVISATWRDLRARINQKRFREDLYYRLAQARVVVPPLSKRPEDIPVLIRHFLDGLPEAARCARTISSEALAELVARDYPGNVRELRHTVERASMLAAGDVILSSDLTFERMLIGERNRSERSTTIGVTGDDELPLYRDAKRTLVDEFERDYLERLLVRTGKNLSRASALAGIERHQLRTLLRRYGLWSSD